VAEQRQREPSEPLHWLEYGVASLILRFPGWGVESAPLPRAGESANNLSAMWTSDGKRVVFASTTTGVTEAFWKAADRSGTEDQISMNVNCHLSPKRGGYCFTRIKFKEALW